MYLKINNCDSSTDFALRLSLCMCWTLWRSLRDCSSLADGGSPFKRPAKGQGRRGGKPNRITGLKMLLLAEDTTNHTVLYARGYISCRASFPPSVGAAGRKTGKKLFPKNMSQFFYPFYFFNQCSPNCEQEVSYFCEAALKARAQNHLRRRVQ